MNTLIYVLPAAPRPRWHAASVGTTTRRPPRPRRPRVSTPPPQATVPVLCNGQPWRPRAASEAILITIIIVIGGVRLGRLVAARRRRGPKETPACGGVSVPGVTLVARRALVMVAMVNNSFLRLNEKSLSRFD